MTLLEIHELKELRTLLNSITKYFCNIFTQQDSMLMLHFRKNLCNHLSVILRDNHRRLGEASNDASQIFSSSIHLKIFFRDKQGIAHLTNHVRSDAFRSFNTFNIQTCAHFYKSRQKLIQLLEKMLSTLSILF